MTVTAEEQSIRELLDRLADDWNRADVDAYGSLFTEDARYITFFGGIYRGRAEIVASHRVLWAKALKGTRMQGEVIEIRFVAPDVAIVVGRGEVTKKSPKKLPKVQSFVVVRQDDGRWLFAHFHNTKRAWLMRFLTYMLGPEAIPSLDR